VLPLDPTRARLTNAGVMELGQMVCTARAPRCAECPLIDSCAWRAAGYPAYDGARAPRQKKYEGSDRQVRGLILRELRASDIPVPAEVVSTLWVDAVQLERALAGLLRDGLVVGDALDGYRLP
jgi:A/G-specific adenine glycosylase